MVPMPRLLPLLLLLAAAPAPAPQVGGGRVVTVRQRVLVRVPRMLVLPGPIPRPIRWEEKRGPTCVAASDLRGAILSARDRIDLVLAGGGRVRAVLEAECRGLDFYRGFYVKPAADGMVCADRDLVRTRAGGKCPIDRFRKLVPHLDGKGDPKPVRRP